MFEISLTQALAFYSSLVVLGAFFIWFYTEVNTHHAYRVLERQYLWRCVFCAFTYLDEAAERVSKCPRCHSLNSIDDAGARYAGVTLPSTEPVSLSVIEPPRRNPSHRKRPGARNKGPRRRR